MPGTLGRSLTLIAALVAAAAVLTLLFDTSGADAAGGATLTVTPESGLVDQQVVSLAGTGFAAASTVYVIECSSSAAEAASCDTANLTTTTTGADGAFTDLGYVVRTGPVGDGRCDAQSRCYIAATSDVTGADPSQRAEAPISFAKVRATKTVARSSAAAVRTGQAFSISGVVTSKGKGVSGPRVSLYNKLGHKYDRVGSKAVLVARATTRPNGRFRFLLSGLAQTAHYIVEMPQTEQPEATYTLSYSKVLNVR